MCGIAGVFDYRRSTSVDPEEIMRMTRTLCHRGPDDEGYVTRPGLGLGARRLSIVDVAGGHQPLTNEDGTVVVALNGEIYNYAELSDRLRSHGHRLSTYGDTETIAHLFEERGATCVEDLDGMFALAVYTNGSPERGRGPSLLLARDRLGKKPLYYADVQGKLIFGSELKAVTAHRDVPRDLDSEALHHYLSLLTVPAPLSIFGSIRKLPPGHLLECDANGVRVRPYWRYAEHVAERRLPEDEVVAEVRRLLFAAVKKRLIGEVPLGVFLSGGLDSSVVTAIMAQLIPQSIRTFSVGFDGSSKHDERSYARLAADHLGTEHREFMVRPNIVELLPQLVHFADEPLAISSAIPTFLLAREARREATVILTGDGGDEVFGGYEYYRYERWHAAYRRLPVSVDGVLSKLADRAAGSIDSARGRYASRLGRFVRASRTSIGARRLAWSSGMTELEKANLYTPAYESTLTGSMTSTFLDRQLPSVHPPLTELMLLDALVWLPDEMLAKVDRMTMAASVEARCPLLDQELVEFVAGLDSAQKVPGARPQDLKSILRRVAADLLPPALLKRPKHGFIVPLDAWYRGEARPFVADVLSASRVRRRGIFRPEAVNDLLERHWSGSMNASNRIHALLTFELWADEFLP